MYAERYENTMRKPSVLHFFSCQGIYGLVIGIKREAGKQSKSGGSGGEKPS